MKNACFKEQQNSTSHCMEIRQACWLTFILYQFNLTHLTSRPAEYTWSTPPDLQEQKMLKRRGVACQHTWLTDDVVIHHLKSIHTSVIRLIKQKKEDLRRPGLCVSTLHNICLDRLIVPAQVHEQTLCLEQQSRG